MTFEQAKKIFQNAGLDLYEMQFRQLSTYLEKLVETNQHFNLTSIIEPAEIWAKHFLDSAVLLQKIPISIGSHYLDVGTGAGFPGMVLAILRPDLQVTLLDSLQKRVDFLVDLAEYLGIDNVRCVHARAEDAAKMTEYREKFDFVTARAVAALPVLLEYCLPFVKLGGMFCAMKGSSESGRDVENAAWTLGGSFQQEVNDTLENVGQRRLIFFEKVEKTPAQYPRRGDKIQKKPL